MSRGIDYSPMRAINSAHASDARARAIAALNRSLRKYERLCGPPRHLQFPVVGCGLDALERSCLQALAKGRIEFAWTMWAMHVLERRRLVALGGWLIGDFTRSEACWQAMAERLADELDEANAYGALGKDEQRKVLDRISDCMARAGWVHVVQSLN